MVRQPYGLADRAEFRKSLRTRLEAIPDSARPVEPELPKFNSAHLESEPPKCSLAQLVYSVCYHCFLIVSVVVCVGIFSCFIGPQLKLHFLILRIPLFSEPLFFAKLIFTF
jgi:hypothetical protein